MNRYAVFWTDTAAADLRGILEYIREESPQNAETVLKQIQQAAAELDHAPFRGRIVPELLSFGIRQYRELIVSRWRMIYRVDDERVYVLSVLDARQDVEEILFWRMIRRENP